MEKTRKLGQTDIEITAIGYGCMGQTHAYGVVEAEEDMVALMRYVKYPLSKICILLWQGRMREPISRFAKNWGSPMCRPAL